MSSDRRRPLARVSAVAMVYSLHGSIAQLTDVQFVAIDSLALSRATIM